MISNKKKITVIIIIVVVIASLLTGYFYFKWKEHRLHNGADKVTINNQHIKALTDIPYGSKYPKSYLDILTPEELDKDEKLPVIFWMHGGGYIAGDKQYKNNLLSKIAEKGYIVVNINYALAPDYKYPTQLRQMDKAVSFIKQNTHGLPIDYDRVIFGGDSAGAQMASQYTAMQTNKSLREEMDFEQQFDKDAIKAAIFFGGFYDMQTVRETEFPRIELFMKSYTGKEDWEHNFKDVSEMSTVKQATKDYPPTFLSVGDVDPFDSQNRAFYSALKEKDVPVEGFFFDGSHNLHHQYQFHLDKPESKENIRRVRAFLREHTDSSGFRKKPAGEL
ncbi:alpha/beta hydrolase [Staphylococcus massiliensis]|uniref:alpha/beta hydrolase n=1 Tax=Staphylococcus massiliensis TaxID=555791 RepID=UPI001EDF3AFD|nr:alpha/beta hydrolase [Staphylococcus massiliensis]MCG3413146.1 alpha/beta hydrolase [Staphylococcus massiliensis]